jgi:hypothetical protein
MRSSKTKLNDRVFRAIYTRHAQTGHAQKMTAFIMDRLTNPIWPADSSAVKGAEELVFKLLGKDAKPLLDNLRMDNEWKSENMGPKGMTEYRDENDFNNRYGTPFLNLYDKAIDIASGKVESTGLYSLASKEDVYLLDWDKRSGWLVRPAGYERPIADGHSHSVRIDLEEFGGNTMVAERIVSFLPPPLERIQPVNKIPNPELFDVAFSRGFALMDGVANKRADVGFIDPRLGRQGLRILQEIRKYMARGEKIPEELYTDYSETMREMIAEDNYILYSRNTGVYKRFMDEQTSMDREEINIDPKKSEPRKIRGANALYLDLYIIMHMTCNETLSRLNESWKKVGKFQTR